ncbi:ATP-binding protein [Actinoplanes sichuanensis]|uniref:ATP-binding protein n=1 Tax=Actinoplanes sichuanensis TaxID=512349 RepID=A0ABW4ANI2_9ACTN|nr:ATP-binding protein [Actinoplanes sichuanensis]
MVSELNAEIELPDGNGAASTARAALRALLAGWRLTDEAWLYDATLIVSELVTNAVRHGGGCLALHVHADDGDVSLAVTDGSAEMPHRRTADERSAGGRGLVFVDAFAETWGAHPHGDGKQVWVRLAPYPA